MVSVNVPEDAPDSVALPDNDRLMSDLLTVQFKQAAVDATVTVAAVPLLASKLTVSVLLGTPAPPAPPDDRDQLVLLLLSQVPEPPTQ